MHWLTHGLSRGTLKFLMELENTMICCHLEMEVPEIGNGNKEYHDMLSIRNEVSNALFKAKLDPPPVETTNPVGQPHFSTASSE